MQTAQIYDSVKNRQETKKYSKTFFYYHMDAPHGHWQSVLRKSLTGTAQECSKLYWTNPGCNISWHSSCMATYLLSLKPSKSDEQGMQNTAWEVRTNSQVTILLWTLSHWCASVGWQTRTYLHKLCTNTVCSLEDLQGVMDERDEWWERESGKSVLAAWLDADEIKFYVVMFYW